MAYLAAECGGIGQALLLRPAEVVRLAVARRRAGRPGPGEGRSSAVVTGPGRGRSSAVVAGPPSGVERPGPDGTRPARGAARPGGTRASSGGPVACREGEQESSAFAAVLARGPLPVPAAHDPTVAEGRAVVTWADEQYPPQLRELPDPPPALFLDGLVKDGLRALAERHVVAVVGSRSPSPYGREMAAAVARDLTAAGVLVVSGLALGIDAAAHEAALAAVASDDGSTRSRPRVATVAVLGCGADVVHPPGNRALFAGVRRAGLIASEFPWGAGARPWRFPARNRVMAGLAEAVLVVEGAGRSGALITARHASEFGREVLAVPGEAGRRLSEGPHRLLRQGAALCESAADVLEVLGLGSLALGWTTRMAGDGDSAAAEDARDDGPGGAATPGERLVRVLDGGAQTADQLAAALKLPIHVVLATLSGLEVDGAVEACGGVWRLRRQRR